MIVSQDSAVVECSQEHVATRQIGILLTSEILLSNLLYDAGDGYRPFHPLILQVDGVEIELPAPVGSGFHVFTLLGEGFEGTGLSIVGHNLQAVSQVTLGGVDVALQAVATPLTCYGDPNALNVQGSFGARCLDVDTGFWYIKGLTQWQQQQ